jgi:hypothetical protein
MRQSFDPDIYHPDHDIGIFGRNVPQKMRDVKLNSERNFTRAFLFFFAFLQALAGRFYIEPDGVNYLDSARAYFHHDWSLAFNGWWSPLYSWLLAVSFAFFRPAPSRESTLLHMLNLAIFFASLVSFEFFLREAIGNTSPPASGKQPGITARSIWRLGYALFAFSTLFLISVRLDTPDLSVACFVFLASALALRIRSGKATTKIFLLLGLVLALGYFAKTIMFPLAFVFFFSAGLELPVSPRRLFQLLTSVGVFLTLTSPFVYFLSVRAGHPTFGEIGRMAYAMYVNGVPDPVHWQVGVAGTGHPVHPMGISNTTPPIYIFAQPLRTSYPPWYDGSYWYAGVTPRFDLHGQLRVLENNLSLYYLEFLTRREFIVGFLILAVFCGSWRTVSVGILLQWPILLPAVAAFSAYAFVHAEPRFLGAFFTMFWIAMFLGIRNVCTGLPTRLTNSVSLVIVFLVAITCVAGATSDLRQLLANKHNEEWEAARALRSSGILPGDSVAIIGHSNVADYWAHLAELTILAEITLEDAPAFWRDSPEAKAKIFKAFREAGARAVITTSVPDSDLSKWTHLGQSPYFAFSLSQTESRGSTQ